jgi:beta-lactamase class A
VRVITISVCLSVASTVGLALIVAGAAAPAPSALETRIVQRIASFKGVMGVAARNLDTGETVLVNPDTRFPTASAIKTAVMVEVYHQLAEGRLGKQTRVTLTDEVKVGGSGVLQHLGAGLSLSVPDLVTLMMTLSDNTATNMLIALVGTANVDRRLAAYGLVDTKLFRPTFRGGHADVAPELEPEFGLGMSTPRELARLMELIVEGKVVSRSASDEMMAVLERQQHRDLIPRALPEVAGLRVGNKAGWDEEKLPGPDGRLRHVRADAGFVISPAGRYVIAICARQVEDTRWGPDNEAMTLGAAFSRMVYDHFLGR